MIRDVVVVGASAGGVESLRAFLGALPADLPAGVLVVLHLPASGSSMLPAILDRVSGVPVSSAGDHQPLRPGTVLVAPPDRHLLVLDDHVVLSRGPRESGHRPAIDVLFRSAARARGSRVIGVMLSGALDDGTAGMHAIRQCGGLVLAQDPAQAAYPSMPRSVIARVGADHVAGAEELGRLVGQLAGEVGEVWPTPGEADQTVAELLDTEVLIAAMDGTVLDRPDRPGVPSGFSCPDCSGALFDIADESQLRFRCRVGHAWSSSALLAEQGHTVDTALWMAVRSLEERAALNRQLAGRAAERGNIMSEQQYLERANEAAQSAAVVRKLLEEPVPTEVARQTRGGPAGGPVDDAEEEHAEQP